MPKPLLTWYTIASTKSLAVFFANVLARQTDKFSICLSILLPTYLAPEDCSSAKTSAIALLQITDYL